MPARLLKRFGTATQAAATRVLVGSVVPASRVLVISKITVCNLHTSTVTFALYVGPVSTNYNQGLIAYNMTLNVGQVYTESGLVALAGEGVQIYLFGATADLLTVTVHGEEVDA